MRVPASRYYSLMGSSNFSDRLDEKIIDEAICRQLSLVTDYNVRAPETRPLMEDGFLSARETLIAAASEVTGVASNLGRRQITQLAIMIGCS